MALTLNRFPELGLPMILNRIVLFSVSFAIAGILLAPMESQAQTATGGTQDSVAGATGTGLRDADEAFSNVERGSAVGTTSNSGASFSAVGDTAAGGGTGGFGGGFGGGGFGGLGALFGGQGFGGGGQNSTSSIRTRLKSGIRVQRPSSDRVQYAAQTRLQTAPSAAGVTGVRVQMQGQTAVLSGVVATARQRRMSELMMMLEPGVKRVQNELAVAR